MERVAAVKRRQEAALGRGARALFEMQVRDNERAMRARVGGAGVVERQREPRELDLDCGLAPAGLPARAARPYLAMLMPNQVRGSAKSPLTAVSLPKGRRTLEFTLPMI